MRESILQKIKTDCPSFKRVELVADMKAVLNGDMGLQNLPALFLRLHGEGAAVSSKTSTSLRMKITKRWEAVIVTKSYNQPSGAKASAAVDVLVCELDQALLGFVPTDAGDLMVRSSNAGSVLRWDDTLYFYGVRYEAPIYLTKNRGS